MLKRRLSSDESGPRASLYDNDPARHGKRRRPLFRPKKDILPRWTPTKKRAMSPLLDFILQHEEAFNDPHRLASLYADFGQQLEVNPEGYQANVAAWIKALADASRAGVLRSQSSGHDLFHIHATDELARALQHPQHGKPTCLPAVFHEAAQKREMIPLKDFISSKESIYKTTWLPSPWKVLTWSLRQVGVLGPAQLQSLGASKVVVVKNVEVAAEKILQEMRGHSSTADRVLSRADFQKRFSKLISPGACLGANDMDTLLVYLGRDRQAISFNAQTVKFKLEHEAVPLPITKEDTAIATLRDTLANVNAQILLLMGKAADANAAAREAVSAKQMVRAKAALRTKKLAEIALDQRTEIAHQLETVFTDLQQAADQVEIVEAMRAGAAALKGLNEQVGGAEGVQGVVDAVNEQMATTEEITNIINENGQPLDEMDIDDELAALEKADMDKKEQDKAERTAARFLELEALEKQRMEKEAAEKKRRISWQAARTRERAQREEEKVVRNVDDASASLSNLSFDQQNTDPEEHEYEERRPMHA